MQTTLTSLHTEGTHIQYIFARRKKRDSSFSDSSQFKQRLNERKRNAIYAPAKRNALTTQSPATLPTWCTTEPRRSSYTLCTASLQTDNISDTTE